MFASAQLLGGVPQYPVWQLTTQAPVAQLAVVVAFGAKQVVPHTPQLPLSARLLQEPLQFVNPVAHVIPHDVPSHVATPFAAGGGHTVQFDPQAFTSFATHCEPHQCVPPVHWHVLLTQCFPPVHAYAVPQPPQLLSSLAVLTHEPLQTVIVGSLQWGTQTLPMQLAVAFATVVVHWVPQVPQLLVSVLVSVQAPLQRLSPPVHWHVELMQTVFATVHLVPHAPQLLLSVTRFVHVLGQARYLLPESDG